MAKCHECKTKIEYNHYHMYRGKVLCYDCYDTRLERKKAKKEAAEQKVAEDAIDVQEELKSQAEDDANAFYKGDPEE